MREKKRKKTGKKEKKEEKKINTQLSHYSLNDNGKKGRMMVVRDIQAADSAVSQTITSTCREEPEQWNGTRGTQKGEAELLGALRPCGGAGPDICPAGGNPLPTR